MALSLDIGVSIWYNTNHNKERKSNELSLRSSSKDRTKPIN